MAAKCGAILLHLMLITDTVTCTPDGGSNNRSPESNPSVFPFLRSVFSSAIGVAGDNSNDNRQPETWFPDIGDFGFRVPQLIPTGAQHVPSLPQQQQQPQLSPIQPQSNGNIRLHYPTLPEQNWKDKPTKVVSGQQQQQQQQSSSAVVTSPPQIRRVIFGRCPDFPCPNGLICDLKSNSCRYYFYDY